VDSFSKYLFSSLLKTVNSTTIKECFEQAFLQLGLSMRIYTDRGTYYASEELQKYFKELNIVHIMPPPNCPFVLGQAESFVAEVKKKLKFIMGTDPNSWSKNLSIITVTIVIYMSRQTKCRWARISKIEELHSKQSADAGTETSQLGPAVREDAAFS